MVSLARINLVYTGPLIAAVAAILILAQLSNAPAFAVTRNFPVYVYCHVVNIGQGSLGRCDPGQGDVGVYSTANPTGASQVAMYMEGAAFSLSSGNTATLSSISSSDVRGKLVLNSGDSVNVVAYLDDPRCTRSWECAYQGITSGLYSKSQNTVGTFTFSGAKLGPNKSYSITTTSSNFQVIAYADAQTTGTYGSYADMKNSPNGVFSFKITETN